MRYLLDTNAYFAVLGYLANQEKNVRIENILKGECFISKVTQIEIISVIGQYARGQSRQTPICERIHADTNNLCEARYIIEKRKKWSGAKIRDWLKLEREISTGVNPLFQVRVLDVTEKVIIEAEKFIYKALVYNFKSMDSVILGTAKAYSEDGEDIVIVTADKGFRAGMTAIGYPFDSLV